MEHPNGRVGMAKACAGGRLLPTGRAIIAERLIESVVKTSRMQMARAPRMLAQPHAITGIMRHI